MRKIIIFFIVFLTSVNLYADEAACLAPLARQVKADYDKNGSITLDKDYMVGYFLEHLDECNEWLKSVTVDRDNKIENEKLKIFFNFNWKDIKARIPLRYEFDLGTEDGYLDDQLWKSCENQMRRIYPGFDEDFGEKVLGGKTYNINPNFVKANRDDIFMYMMEHIAMDCQIAGAQRTKLPCECDLITLAKQDVGQLSFNVGIDTVKIRFDTSDLFTGATVMDNIVFLVSNKVIRKSDPLSARKVEAKDIKDFFWPGQCSDHTAYNGIENSDVNKAGRAVFGNDARYFMDFPSSKNYRFFPGVIISWKNNKNDVIAYHNLWVMVRKARQFADALSGTGCSGAGNHVYLAQVTNAGDINKSSADGINQQTMANSMALAGGLGAIAAVMAVTGVGLPVSIALGSAAAIVAAGTGLGYMAGYVMGSYSYFGPIARQPSLTIIDGPYTIGLTKK